MRKALTLYAVIFAVITIAAILWLLVRPSDTTQTDQPDSNTSIKSSDKTSQTIKKPGELVIDDLTARLDVTPKEGAVIARHIFSFVQFNNPSIKGGVQGFIRNIDGTTPPITFTLDIPSAEQSYVITYLGKNYKEPIEVACPTDDIVYPDFQCKSIFSEQ